MRRGLKLPLIGILAALQAPTAASARDETVKVGVIATFSGAFASLGKDGMRGVELAVSEFGSSIAGRKIEIIQGSSDATPDSAVSAARKLVEQDGVKFVIGPLSGDEGIAIKDYAKTVPNVTFVNGTSGAQDTTMKEPAPNFFRFTLDGAQWMAGLGRYVHDVRKFSRVVTVAEDYSYPYTQVFGFMAEFCTAGGHVPAKFWVPIGTKDYSSVISAIPDDVDAIYVALGGADAVNFLTQYQDAQGKAPLIGASSTVDQTVLSVKGRARDGVVGMVSAGPVSDNSSEAAWLDFVNEYRKLPGSFPSPSLFAQGYYVNAKALLTGIQAVNGDISDGGLKLRQALSNLRLDTPTGPVSLDKNRNGIGNVYLSEVSVAKDGSLFNKLILTIRDVNQTLGMPADKFAALGAPNRDNPSCK